MCKKNLDQCRSGKDFVEYAEKHGARVTNGHGSHHKVITDRGTCIVPVHNGDLGRGLLHQIIKTFKLIGLAAFTAGWLYVLIAGGMP